MQNEQKMLNPFSNFILFHISSLDSVQKKIKKLKNFLFFLPITDQNIWFHQNVFCIFFFIFFIGTFCGFISIYGCYSELRQRDKHRGTTPPSPSNAVDITDSWGFIYPLKFISFTSPNLPPPPHTHTQLPMYY